MGSAGEPAEEEEVADSDSDFDTASSSEDSAYPTDEEDAVLPLGEEAGSLASLIAINQTYLDLLGRLGRKLDVAIEHNREKQVGDVLELELLRCRDGFGSFSTSRSTTGTLPARFTRLLFMRRTSRTLTAWYGLFV